MEGTGLLTGSCQVLPTCLQKRPSGPPVSASSHPGVGKRLLLISVFICADFKDEGSFLFQFAFLCLSGTLNCLPCLLDVHAFGFVDRLLCPLCSAWVLVGTQEA